MSHQDLAAYYLARARAAEARARQERAAGCVRPLCEMIPEELQELYELMQEIADLFPSPLVHREWPVKK